MCFISNKNLGYKHINDISDIIIAKTKNESDLNLSPKEIAPFNYAPITSCDFE